VQKGAKILAGGKRVGKGLFFEPTVLDHCTHEMKVIAEETFGPVLSVVRVKNLDEAVTLANDSIYGLNASIWSADVERAVELGKRLQAGTVFVNNHALTGAMPFAPWTGVKQSGYGVANSTFALANYTRPKTTFIDRNDMPDPWWFPLDESLVDIGHRLAEVQLGHVSRALKLPSLLKSRAKKILEFVKAGG
jgi:acyl-CoA reductase-like NAD-dependent aldehyde dehydrogenase